MTPEWLLPVLYGTLVGLALGLTGGGGSIFAVPILIYGLQVGVRDAVGVSLAAVGATALFGAVMRWRSGEVDVIAGSVFALAGIFGAPAGMWLGRRVPDTATLLAFASLMTLVAWRMWRAQGRSSQARVQATAATPEGLAVETVFEDEVEEERGSSEVHASRPPADSPLTVPDDLDRRRGTCGRLRCGLIAAGLVVGILSGFFGVGGGFLIVPALVMAGGLGMHRAVATSLFAIALISASGVASYRLQGGPIPVGLVVAFASGGVLGMLAGGRLRALLSSVLLARIFAGGMWATALVMVGATLWELA